MVNYNHTRILLGYGDIKPQTLDTCKRQSINSRACAHTTSDRTAQKSFFLVQCGSCTKMKTGTPTLIIAQTQRTLICHGFVLYNIMHNKSTTNRNTSSSLKNSKAYSRSATSLQVSRCRAACCTTCCPTSPQQINNIR